MNKKRLIPVIITVVAAIILAVIFVKPGSDAPAVNDMLPGNNSTPANSTPEHNAIKDGKVWVDNYVSGTAAEYYIDIYNANNHASAFSVDFRVADTLQEGYTRAPSDVRDWVVIDEKQPLVQPHEWHRVTIRLGMPSHATPPADKWEFWVGVIDLSQTGNIQVELCQRWMITMAT